MIKIPDPNDTPKARREAKRQREEEEDAAIQEANRRHRESEAEHDGTMGRLRRKERIRTVIHGALVAAPLVILAGIVLGGVVIGIFWCLGFFR